MRSFAFISILLAATQVFAAPTPTTPVASIEAGVEPGSELAGSFPIEDATPVKARSPLSNAERFARGLPPAPLKQDHGIARRAGVSPTPQITKRGIIQITNTANGEILGFISKNPFSTDQYRSEPSESEAQLFTFKVDSGATSVSSADLTSLNGIAGFPYTGLVQGRDTLDSNIGPGSYHYGYIAGTNQTPVDSPPQIVGNSYSAATGVVRASESAVWNINLVTGTTTVQWVNSDGSKPATFSFLQSTAIYFGGDPAAFNARYPAPITHISYKFLERP